MPRVITQVERKARDNYIRHLNEWVNSLRISKTELADWLGQGCGREIKPQYLSKVLAGKFWPHEVVNFLETAWPESLSWKTDQTIRIDGKAVILDMEDKLPTKVRQRLEADILEVINKRRATKGVSERTHPFSNPCPRWLRKEHAPNNEEARNQWVDRTVARIRLVWGLGETAPIASVEQMLEENSVTMFHISSDAFKGPSMRLFPGHLSKRKYFFIAMPKDEGNNALKRPERRMAVCEAFAKLLAWQAEAMEVRQKSNPDYAQDMACALLLPTPTLNKLFGSIRDLVISGFVNQISEDAVLALEAVYGLPRTAVIERLRNCELIDRACAETLKRNLRTAASVSPTEESVWSTIVSFPPSKISL